MGNTLLFRGEILPAISISGYCFLAHVGFSDGILASSSLSSILIVVTRPRLGFLAIFNSACSSISLLSLSAPVFVLVVVLVEGVRISGVYLTCALS